MPKSPFVLLKEAIENELFDTSLRLQSHLLNGVAINSDFICGYTEALKLALQYASYIYRYKQAPPF